jgi:hypothetical protein
LEKYIVTCYHCIYNIDKIYIVDNNNKKIPVEWHEHFSSMEKDIAVLKVKNLDVEPLKIATETFPDIEVYIKEYTSTNIENFPNGQQVEGKINLNYHFFKLPAIIYKWNNKWNKKPEVSVDVYGIDGKFELGFSGSVVFFPKNEKVVGMFTTKDDNYGYIIPIKTQFQRFYKIMLNLPKDVSFFIDKPNIKNLNVNKKILYKLKEILSENNDITFKFLEPDKYSKYPLERIRKVLEEFHGIIIIGFKQFCIT